MKKIFALCSLVIFVGVITGCGNTKKLQCTQTDDSDSDMKMEQVITATFKNDKVTFLEIQLDTVLSDTNVDYIDTFTNALKQQYEEYEDVKGVDVEISSKNNTVSVLVKEDLEKMDDESKEKFSVNGTSENLKEVKASLEEEGYSCKEL